MAHVSKVPPPSPRIIRFKMENNISDVGNRSRKLVFYERAKVRASLSATMSSRRRERDREVLKTTIASGTIRCGQPVVVPTLPLVKVKVPRSILSSAIPRISLRCSYTSLLHHFAVHVSTNEKLIEI